MDLTIGCTTRPHNKLTVEEAFERIAAAGYTDVAVFNQQGQMPVRSDSTSDEIAAVRKAAADAGLIPSMLIGRTRLDLGLDAAVDDYRRLISNTAELGTTWLLDCGTSKEADFDAYLELMARAAPYAEDLGVKITMKPHGGISLTGTQLIAAHKRVAHPAFTICYDPGNIIYYTKGAKRPEQDVVDVAPVAATFIVKDCQVADDKASVAVTAGDGLVDFAKVLSILAAAGFDGPAYVECVGSTETAAIDRDLAFTLGYVKGILAAM